MLLQLINCILAAMLPWDIFWARTAVLAKAKLAEFDADLSTDKSLQGEYGFYDAKVKTAEFILPS